MPVSFMFGHRGRRWSERRWGCRCSRSHFSDASARSGVMTRTGQTFGSHRECMRRRAARHDRGRKVADRNPAVRPGTTKGTVGYLVFPRDRPTVQKMRPAHWTGRRGTVEVTFDNGGKAIKATWHPAKDIWLR